MDGTPKGKFQKIATILGQAIFTIMVADLVMSTDHFLAVAGASKGSLLLLIFGLGLGVPLLFLPAMFFPRSWMNILSIYIGAGNLGRVAGDIITTDSFKPQPFRGLFYELYLQLA